MKTKDFIKMLQEADPSGEAHVRMEGGIPCFAELKPGYWDGSYTFIDEDGNFVTSIKDVKVDIYTMSIDDFVERHFNYHDPNSWDKIKEKFKFELGGYCIKEQRDEKAESVLKSAKEAYDEWYDISKTHYEKALEEMQENSKKGWTWFQNKKVDSDEKPNMHHYYTWKVYDKDKKEQGSNLHNTECIQHSGLWEKIDNRVKEGYYQWILK
jgi:hypothetical protein